MRLGPYEVIDEIGRGGMGTVLRARAPEGAKFATVAIKVMSRAGNEAGLARFERERRLLESVGETEGFVPLIDSGEAASGPFLVMPFIGGGTLRARLAREGRMAIGAAVELAKTLARALGHAHARGIVHRDLKPENVLFTDGPEPRPLIADLGLGKFSGSGAAKQSVVLSKTGEMRGTIGYMAPEQIVDSHSVGPPADVFAVGTILYECLSGEPAFAGDSALEVIGKVTEGRLEPIQSLRPEVPRWLAVAVGRALAHAPRARPQDGEALARLLEAGEDGLPRRGVGLALAVGAVVLGTATAATLAIGASWGSTGPSAGANATGTGTGTSAAGSATATPPVGTKLTPPRELKDLPAACRPFARTTLTRLTGLLGGYAWKCSDSIRSIAPSRDGTTAATVCRDGTVRLFDLATGAERVSYSLSGPLLASELAPELDRAAGFGEDEVLRVVELSSGREVGRLDHARTSVSDFDLAPDGKHVALGTVDGRLELWELFSGKSVRGGAQLVSTKVHEAWIGSVRFSRDGSRILTGGHDGSIGLFEAATGKELRRWRVHADRVNSVAFLPGDQRALSAGADAAVKVIDLVRNTWRSIACDRHILSIVPSADGTLALATGQNGTLMLIDVAEARIVATWRGLGDAAVRTAAFLPDGRRVLTGGDDQVLRVWDIERGVELNETAGHRGGRLAVALGPDGRQALAGGSDRALKLWDLASGREVRTFAGHKDTVTGVALSPDGTRAVSASHDKTLRIWDVARGSELLAIGPRTHWTQTLAFLPDGRRFNQGGGGDLALRTWDLSGRELQTHEKHGSHGGATAFTPTGRYGLAARLGGPIELVNLSSGRTGQLVGHTGLVQAIACFHDGKRAVSAGVDHTLRLWDLTNGDAVATLGSHERPVVVALAASADDRRVASAGDDGKILLWEVSARALVDTIDLASTGDAARSLAFAPDGRSLVVGTNRGVVLVFELAP